MPRLTPDAAAAVSPAPVDVPRHALAVAVRVPAAILLCLACSTAARGEDRVILQREGRVSRTHLHGEVTEFTSRALTIRSAAGDKMHTYPADEVVQVVTGHTPAFERATTHFENGRIIEADREFASALKEEPRLWVQQEIRAMRVRCALRMGDRRTACERFLELVRDEPESRHFDVMPLLWAPEVVDRGLTAEAATWMNAGGAPSRLLAASLLLNDERHASHAQETLQVLVRGSHPQVRDLAALQQWRLRLASGDVSELEVARWENRMKHLPRNLRAGGYFLIGRARQQRREAERAAQAYLWLPLVYDRNDRLAARAGLAAADCLASLQQRREALTIFREVARRYADMPSGLAAAEQVRTLSSLNQLEASPPRN